MIDLNSSISQATRPLERRIRGMTLRSTIARVTDAGNSQRVQVSGFAKETLDNVLRLQDFGFTSNPPAGCSGLVICIGGSRTHPVFLGGEDASRPTGLQSGESAQYNAFGDFIRINADGSIHVKASGTVTVDSPLVDALHDVTVRGDLTVNGTSHLVGNVTADANVGIAGNLDVEGDSTGSGSLTVAGEIKSNTSVSDPKGSMDAMRGTYNGHGHPAANDPPSELME